ncbi:MAG: RNA pyrophosphohydrolase [Rhizobiales bacterium PAR1]|nr:MAG: RNA pyrophosphohydrolase [Rhizobiales bacterium PAR1]
MARDIASMPYRPCVGIALFNDAGKVFVARRRPDKGPEYKDPVYEWQMPQGGIDPGEDPYAAALRELYEETNVRSVKLLSEAKDWFNYDLPVDTLGKALKGRYRGQTQKWFAFRFTGHESEINVVVPGGGQHKPEFIDWRWDDLSRMPELIIPFKRGVYERVVTAFSVHTTGV